MKRVITSPIVLARFLLVLFTVAAPTAWGAYLRNVPQELVQPDGTVIYCLASGDEHFNWVHDELGYVILRDPLGYLVYAAKVDGDLVPTSFRVGSNDPVVLGLEPGLKPDPGKRTSWKTTDSVEPLLLSAPRRGTLNNIVVFVRFSDQAEFADSTSKYDGFFNTNGTSMKSYYLAASYGDLTVSSSFYPPESGAAVVSWQDSLHPRSYYLPYHSVSNVDGYKSFGERSDREYALLKSAIEAVATSIPQNLTVDGDNDGLVDNVCFIVRGGVSGWNLAGENKGWGELLWPHRWQLPLGTAEIRKTSVSTYNFQLESSIDVGVLCHEMFHSLGAPDLYHYDYNSSEPTCLSDKSIVPVGEWDLMAAQGSVPQHMGAYMKLRYGNWIPALNELPQSGNLPTPGNYTLNPITSSTNNNLKVASPKSSTEFFVLEYRKKAPNGLFESSLPGSGLLVYRIDERSDLIRDGNRCGPPDLVYIYRPGVGLSKAALSSTGETTELSCSSGPSPVLSDNTLGGIHIANVQEATDAIRGDTISFDLGFDADLSGLVLDRSGKPFSGISVELIGTSFAKRNESHVVMTGPDGRYKFGCIPSGTYTVRPVSSSLYDFDPKSRSISLVIGNVVNLNFQVVNNPNTCGFDQATNHPLGVEIDGKKLNSFEGDVSCTSSAYTAGVRISAGDKDGRATFSFGLPASGVQGAEVKLTWKDDASEAGTKRIEIFDWKGTSWRILKEWSDHDNVEHLTKVQVALDSSLVVTDSTGAKIWVGVTGRAKSSLHLKSLRVDAVAPASGISVTPTSLDFGSWATGGTAGVDRSIGISSTGTTDLRIATWTISGASGNSFVLNPGDTARCTRIPAMESCSVGVGFHPTTTGTFAADLTIESNDPAHPATTIRLTGVGVPKGTLLPRIAIDPNGVTSFGAVTIGGSASAIVFAVLSIGTAPAVIAKVEVSGTAFSISSNTCSTGTSLAPGKDCRISIRFSPATAGSYAGTLVVSSSGGREEVALEGSGTDPGLATGCFIATAAWGSPLDAHVGALRQFRDEHLATNAVGRKLIEGYYRISPPIAAVISRSERLRSLTRGALVPVVFGVEHPSSTAALLLFGAAVAVGGIRRRRATRSGEGNQLV